MTIFQITGNEVISGVCKAIYDAYDGNITIYKEKEEFLNLPAVCVYCIDYIKTMERSDRFTNVFHIIINYFPPDSVIIKNKRELMLAEVEKIMEAVRYIQLPAFVKDLEGNLVESTLPSRAGQISAEEKKGFVQIAVPYTIRTKKIKKDTIKMNRLDVDVCYNQIGGN